MTDHEPIDRDCHRDLPEREAPCGCCACVELRAELAGLLHLRAHLGTDQAPGWAFTDDDDAPRTTDAPPCSTDTAGRASTRPNGSGPATASARRSPPTPAPNAASPAAGPTPGSTRHAS